MNSPYRNQKGANCAFRGFPVASHVLYFRLTPTRGTKHELNFTLDHVARTCLEGSITVDGTAGVGHSSARDRPRCRAVHPSALCGNHQPLKRSKADFQLCQSGILKRSSGGPVCNLQMFRPGVTRAHPARALPTIACATGPPGSDEKKAARRTGRPVRAARAAGVTCCTCQSASGLRPRAWRRRCSCLSSR